MKLIIDIPDEEYKDIKDNPSKWERYVQTRIGNGIPYEERQKGEWINNECPFCGRYENYPENFCATCGADMREGGAE